MGNTTPSPQSTTTKQPAKRLGHMGPQARQVGETVTMLCGEQFRVRRIPSRSERRPEPRNTCPKCLAINEMEEHLRAVEKQLLGDN